jgi:hypothetical protein
MMRQLGKRHIPAANGYQTILANSESHTKSYYPKKRVPDPKLIINKNSLLETLRDAKYMFGAIEVADCTSSIKMLASCNTINLFGCWEAAMVA